MSVRTYTVFENYKYATLLSQRMLYLQQLRLDFKFKHTMFYIPLATAVSVQAQHKHTYIIIPKQQQQEEGVHVYVRPYKGLSSCTLHVIHS